MVLEKRDFPPESGNVDTYDNVLMFRFSDLREDASLLCDEEMKTSVEAGSEMVRQGERTDETYGDGTWPGLGTEVDVSCSPSRELPCQRFVEIGAR